MQFCFYPLRFEFVASESLFFPPGKAANILRGALGTIFRGIACAPGCESAKTCERRGECPYARVFEPTALESGPSGLADWPRPFVFRARHLDGCTMRTGDSFHFDLNVFSLDRSVLGYFIQTFAALALEGLGPRRGKAELRRVTSGSQSLYASSTHTTRGAIEPVALSLDALSAPIRSVHVRFVSPTELKHEHKIADRPEFAILYGRIRDRIATLSRLYGGVELPIDYQGTNLRASMVRMKNYSGHRLEEQRRSSRTGQSHSIGGFVGDVEYEGDLAEFVPFLQAARWTGVGRQAVWGKGEIEVRFG